MSAERAIVVWCPDWPVLAAEAIDGVPATDPVAVLHAGRVLACSPAARARGVRGGLRTRQAQNRCPNLRLVRHDPGRDARAYEPVLAAIETLVPTVEVLRPGVCAVAARGPARYLGGEATTAERIVDRIAQRCAVEARVGIAEGVFAAGLAARAGLVVPAGRTPAFLAELHIAVLGLPALADLLCRLGIGTLGAFAALPAVDVLTRFGPPAAAAHRLAGGREHRRISQRTPPADLAVTQGFEEPLRRVDTAAFVARSLAARLQTVLDRHGLACTRLVISVRTDAGEELDRTWRHEGPITPTGIADRVRWQLDGWLAGPIRGSAVTPATGITLLRLTPDGLTTQLRAQPGLWGEPGEERDRATRALTRVQGLLGPEAVLTAVLGGGRGQADRVNLVPFGGERVPERAPQARWPGRLPPPSPATVHTPGIPAAVRDAAGGLVGVTGRLAVTRSPASVAVRDARPVPITGWAGPWPVDERWWTEDDHRRYARFQVLLADGRALLLHLATGQWAVAGWYD
ncbi:MAG: DNA polymerase Y family protein [Dactylosporangium sp.]|nr:DNA polymerase Y family protein [Dactylosporangium sp.]